MKERYSQIIDDIPIRLIDKPNVSTYTDYAEVIDSDNFLQALTYTLTKPEVPAIGRKPLIVMVMQWSEHSTRDPQADRAAAISEITGSDVLSIDMPGQSPDSSRLSPAQRTGMHWGDYEPTGEALWQVVVAALEQDGRRIEDEEIVLIGPSQGGAVVSGMVATRPENVDVSEVVLLNSASIENVDDRGGAGLGKDFVAAGTDMPYYAKNNPTWAAHEGMLDLPKRLLARGSGLLFLPLAALARANDTDTLTTALTEREFNGRLHIVHSELDTVSRAINNITAERRLRALGDVNRLELAKEYHGITGHLPSLARIVRAIVSAKA